MPLNRSPQLSVIGGASPHTPSLSSPEPSREIYSEPPSEDPSFLASDDPSNTSDRADVDSLADASPEEVERRALDLLAMESEESLLGSSSKNEVVEILPDAKYYHLSARDLPRIPNLEPDEEAIAVHAAQAFLRKCVADAENTDWMYETPAVFGSPLPLDPRRGEEGMGGAEGSGKEWMNTAFNLESYRRTAYGSYSDTTAEDGEEMEDQDQTTYYDEEDTATGLEFLDIASTGMSNEVYGTPYLRDGEEDAAGAGFGGKRSVRTGALSRGVSLMAV